MRKNTQAKTVERVLVHVRKSQSEKKELFKNIKDLNEILVAAHSIFEELKETNPHKIIESVNEFLQKQVLNMSIKPDKIAEILGFETEYRTMVDLYKLFGRVFFKYQDYIELKNGKYILSESFNDFWNEKHSVYLTNPKAIDIYNHLNFLIDVFEKSLDITYLKNGNRINLRWRFASAFELVKVGATSELEVRWEKIIENYERPQ